ncbi:MAG: hypothetical protein ACJ71P_11800 [Nitrososphaeraceae archaeon]
MKHKKCEVAAVLQVKRWGPQTGVQLSIPAQQTLLTEVDRYG